MQGFVQGADRQQTTLLPECLDDWIDEGNSIRAVDVFVEALDLRDLGGSDHLTVWDSQKGANQIQG
jgi:transposase